MRDAHVLVEVLRNLFRLTYLRAVVSAGCSCTCGSVKEPV